MRNKIIYHISNNTIFSFASILLDICLTLKLQTHCTCQHSMHLTRNNLVNVSRQIIKSSIESLEKEKKIKSWRLVIELNTFWRINHRSLEPVHLLLCSDRVYLSCKNFKVSTSFLEGEIYCHAPTWLLSLNTQCWNGQLVILISLFFRHAMHCAGILLSNPQWNYYANKT